MFSIETNFFNFSSITLKPLIMKPLIMNPLLFLLVSISLISCSNENKESVATTTEKKQILQKFQDFDSSTLVHVGTMVDGEIVLNDNSSTLISTFEKSRGISSESARIYPSDNDTYGLVFKGPNNSKTTYLAVVGPDNGIYAVAGTSCSTSDCSEEQLGCVPEYPDNPAGQSGIGICRPCSNGGKCTKTVSGGGDETIIDPA